MASNRAEPPRLPNSNVGASHPIPYGSDGPDRILDGMLVEKEFASGGMQEDRDIKVMGNERLRVETIPVKIAIKRELAYRRRIKIGHQPHNELSESPMPFQGLLLKPKLVGMKRKEISNELPRLPLLQRRPTSPNRSVDLRCNICQVTCMSEFNLYEHCRSRKHKAKCEEIKDGVKARRVKWCDECCVPCADAAALEQHHAGKKHAARMYVLMVGKKAGSEGVA